MGGVAGVLATGALLVGGVEAWRSLLRLAGTEVPGLAFASSGAKGEGILPLP